MEQTGILVLTDKHFDDVQARYLKRGDQVRWPVGHFFRNRPPRFEHGIVIDSRASNHYDDQWFLEVVTPHGRVTVCSANYTIFGRRNKVDAF